MSSEAITRNDLTAVLNEVLPVGATDYIVEYGTSGNWTYRKWNSGIAECWSSNNRTISSWTAWFSWYYGNPYNVAYTFPTGLFISAPTVTATGSGLATLLMAEGTVTSTSTCYYYPIRPDNLGSGMVVHVYAIGRWK